MASATAVTSAAVRTTAPVRPLKLDTNTSDARKPLRNSLIAVLTKAVVAIRCETSAGSGVGADGQPPKSGDQIGAPSANRMSHVPSSTTPVRPLNEATVFAATQPAVAASVGAIGSRGRLIWPSNKTSWPFGRSCINCPSETTAPAAPGGALL